MMEQRKGEDKYCVEQLIIISVGTITITHKKARNLHGHWWKQLRIKSAN